MIFSELNLNDNINSEELNNALRKLYDTDYFQDIKINFDDDIAYPIEFGRPAFLNESSDYKTCFYNNTTASPTNTSSSMITIAITAPFPEEDTGYIEDGFEFCVQTGANLLSFPCDNQIGVSESLPAGIENFITSIIGQGEATTYNPALGWVGSLDDFTPGSGYWFKSNSSLCFEYECVEN